MGRRRFLSLCGYATIAAAAPWPLRAAEPERRTLALVNTHTGESLTTVFRESGRLRPDALAAIDHILRDHRTGDVKSIDPRLLDLLADIAVDLGTTEPFQVISGYRSPRTNAALRGAGRGVAKRSYHLQGKAIDVRIPGVETAALRRAASRQRRGGVGYYPGPGFVHVDTGPVRAW